MNIVRALVPLILSSVSQFCSPMVKIHRTISSLALGSAQSLFVAAAPAHRWTACAQILFLAAISHELIGFVVAPRAYAQGSAIAPYQGKICLGYNPVTKTFGGLIVSETNPEEFCPKGFALVGHDIPSGRDRDMDLYPIRGDCCELPPDALLPEHQFVPSECPPGFVATGGRTKKLSPPPPVDTPPPRYDDLRYELRCTKINTALYGLSEPRPAVRVGWGKDPTQGLMDKFWGRAETFTTRNLAPAGFRYGLARKSRTVWHGDACAGYPWGSMLVRRGGIRCSQLYFSELLDLQGRPVPLFPSCITITDPLDPNATCSPHDAITLQQ